MEEKDTKYWQLFIKQKDGEITVEQQVELSHWTENNLDVSNEYEEIFQATKDEQQVIDFSPDERWDEVKTIIKIETESLANKTIRLFPWIARVAAAIILVLGFAFIFYQYQDLSSNNLNLQTMVQTNDTDQKVIELPDGSKVWLNRNSELLYPESFDGKTRTLYLKGEAFFEVTPNKDKPFVVHAGISKTAVLGTSFNLRAFGNEAEVRLTVVTGKVAFSLANDTEKVVVIPGGMAGLSTADNTIFENENSDLNFLSWKTKHLMFDDSPMDDMIKSLERHYGIAINVQNSNTLKCRFTGDFRETGLENVLKIITRATSTTYELNKGEYNILGAGCN